MDIPPETPACSFVYHRIPTQVSRQDFNRSIAPHLKRPTKGPQPKLSLYKIFNYILYVLPTGIQWHQRKTNKNELHYINVYKWHNRWSQDGAYHARVEASGMHLKAPDPLDPAVLPGDGSNTVGKKGAKASATPVINTRKGKKSWRSLTITAASSVRSRSHPSTSPTRLFSQRP